MLDVELAAAVGQIEIDLAFEVARGETLAIAGPSGSGKTSVLRMIAGLSAPSRGKVVLDDEVLLDTSRSVSLEPERRHCGYVFQDYALFGHMPVWKNVAFALDSHSRGGRRAAAIELLDRFGIGVLADAHPPTLSGGERQRVALARALASGPRMMLLDEPLSALDVSTRAHAGRELAELLAGLDVPAVFVTHDFMEAALTAQRIAILDAGRIVQCGTAEELAAAPKTPFVADLTGANVLRGNARRRRDGLTEVKLDGGGLVTSTDEVAGAVAVSIHPSEISIEPVGEFATGSAQNRLEAEITTVTAIANRVRIALAAPQPFVADVTVAAREHLALEPGGRVTATWKASATRVLPL